MVSSISILGKAHKYVENDITKAKISVKINTDKMDVAIGVLNELLEKLKAKFNGKDVSISTNEIYTISSEKFKSVFKIKSNSEIICTDIKFEYTKDNIIDGIIRSVCDGVRMNSKVEMLAYTSVSSQLSEEAASKAKHELYGKAMDDASEILQTLKESILNNMEKVFGSPCILKAIYPAYVQVEKAPMIKGCDVDADSLMLSCERRARSEDYAVSEIKNFTYVSTNLNVQFRLEFEIR